jgi:hypothetical protein
MAVAVKHQDGEIGFTRTVTAVDTSWTRVTVDFPIVPNTAMIAHFEGLSFGIAGSNSELQPDRLSVIGRRWPPLTLGVMDLMAALTDRHLKMFLGRKKELQVLAALIILWRETILMRREIVLLL